MPIRVGRRVGCLGRLGGVSAFATLGGIARRRVRPELLKVRVIARQRLGYGFANLHHTPVEAGMRDQSCVWAAGCHS